MVSEMVERSAGGPVHQGWLDEERLDEACELLRALGTPRRLAIVLELAEGPRCVHELVDRLGMSQSLASQHLRVLRSAGLVTAQRRGKEAQYVLADDHVAHIARDALVHGSESPPTRQPAPGELPDDPEKSEDPGEEQL